MGEALGILRRRRYEGPRRQCRDHYRQCRGEADAAGFDDGEISTSFAGIVEELGRGTRTRLRGGYGTFGTRSGGTVSKFSGVVPRARTEPAILNYIHSYLYLQEVVPLDSVPELTEPMDEPSAPIVWSH